MGDRPAVLEVEGVSAGYGETTVIRGIDLSVAEGETTVIVGPNGHGKTTLMRAISGLLPLTAGEVRFGGDSVAGRSVEDIATRGLVHVPQGDHLFPDLSVEENLLMGAFPRSSWRDRAQAYERVYGLFPILRERRAQRASTLSGGERRQTALGRGLMRWPKLLIIDEPSLGLAPIVTDTVYDTISAIAAQGISLLLVEENLQHLEGLQCRVHVLEMGRIVRVGDSREIASDETLAHSYLGTLG